MSVIGGLCDLLSFQNTLPDWVNGFCAELEKKNFSCNNYALNNDPFSKFSSYGKHIFFPLLTGLFGGMTSQFMLPFTVSGPVTIILSSVSSAAAEYSIQEKNGKNIDWGRVFSAGLTSLIGFGGALLYKNSKREIPIWARASLNVFHTTLTEFMGILGEHRIEEKKISLTTIGEKLMNRDIFGLLVCSVIQGEAFHRGAKLFVKTGYEEERAKNLRFNRERDQRILADTIRVGDEKGRNLFKPMLLGRNPKNIILEGKENKVLSSRQRAIDPTPARTSLPTEIGKALKVAPERDATDKNTTARRASQIPSKDLHSELPTVTRHTDSYAGIISSTRKESGSYILEIERPATTNSKSGSLPSPIEHRPALESEIGAKGKNGIAKGASQYVNLDITPTGGSGSPVEIAFSVEEWSGGNGHVERVTHTTSRSGPQGVGLNTGRTAVSVPDGVPPLPIEDRPTEARFITIAQENLAATQIPRDPKIAARLIYEAYYKKDISDLLARIPDIRHFDTYQQRELANLLVPASLVFHLERGDQLRRAMMPPDREYHLVRDESICSIVTDILARKEAELVPFRDHKSFPGRIREIIFPYFPEFFEAADERILRMEGISKLFIPLAG